MAFRTFFYALPPDRREQFAAVAGTSVAYICVHLTRKGRRPRPQLFRKLVAACAQFDGPTEQELLSYFYSPDSVEA
jgi:hypothetical protein